MYNHWNVLEMMLWSWVNDPRKTLYGDDKGMNIFKKLFYLIRYEEYNERPFQYTLLEYKELIYGIHSMENVKK